MARTLVTGNILRSGSIPTTALGGGVVTSSAQIVSALPGGTLSSSAQVTNVLPADVVSSSVQVTAFLPTDTVSSSAQVTAFLPVGTISSSNQVQLSSITGTTFANTNYTFPQAVTASNVLITNIATVRELRTLFVTSSVIYESGSTKFGDDPTDTHQFTGSIQLNGQFYQNNVLVTLTSQDYGLITGIVDNFADYGSIV